MDNTGFFFAARDPVGPKDLYLTNLFFYRVRFLIQRLYTTTCHCPNLVLSVSLGHCLDFAALLIFILRYYVVYVCVLTPVMAKQRVITSWNVRGLGDRVKCLAVLHMVRRLGSSVVCLQETHLSPGQDSPFSAKLFGTQFTLPSPPTLGGSVY